MSDLVVRLPDVGEGVAEAELVAWHVAAGDVVTPNSTVAEVLTDKATVEIYSPVHGRIVALHGEVGQVLAVGADFIVIATDAVAATDATDAAEVPDDAAPQPGADTAEIIDNTPIPEGGDVVPGARRLDRAVVSAAPAVRERARSLGIDLDAVAGSGPDGRITHQDLDRYRRAEVPPTADLDPPSTQTPLIGLRRKIAARMTLAASRIPHITYVDDVDMTAVEQLRRTLAKEYPEQRLTVLPLIMSAVVQAIAVHPQVNSTFDDDTQTLTTHSAVHIGVATQAADGLIVPVVRRAQTMGVWQLAVELQRVTSAARQGSATRAELAGSTITITSLGALGGLVTTPIINHPEVAIIGVNKLQTRAMWDGNSFVPRTMMNLSSSFDHRIIDGWLAATFIQRVKHLLEEPTLLFVAPPPQSGV